MISDFLPPCHRSSSRILRSKIWKCSTGVTCFKKTLPKETSIRQWERGVLPISTVSITENSGYPYAFFSLIANPKNFSSDQWIFKNFEKICVFTKNQRKEDVRVWYQRNLRKRTESTYLKRSTASQFLQFLLKFVEKVQPNQTYQNVGKKEKKIRNWVRQGV